MFSNGYYSRRRVRRVVLAALTTLVAASLTAISAPGASAQIGSDGNGGVEVDAGYLHLDMNSTGQVISLIDNRTGQNYIATGQGTAPW